VTVALTFVGWLDLVAAVVLAGGLLHARLVGEPSAAGRRVLGRAAWALAIVLPLEFGLTALRMYDVSGVRGTALVWDLLRARWGELWALRCLGLAVLASSTRFAAALAAPWLLLRSFQGHAGAHGTVPALIDWLHLTAAAVWIGSLVQLALLPRPLPAVVAERVRTLATLALAVLVPAGAYAAVLHVQRLDMLIRSPYGLALLVKLALATALVALGAANHFRHVPAMRRGEGAAPARLARAVGVELVIAAAVLLVTSLLGALPMPHTMPHFHAH